MTRAATKYEQSAIERGGQRMPGGMLRPEEAEALEYLRTVGYGVSYREAIGRALVETAERLKKQ